MEKSKASKKDKLEKELRKLKEIYDRELKRKDKQIDELKEQNSLIMKSALRQSERLTNLSEKLKKILAKRE